MIKRLLFAGLLLFFLLPTLQARYSFWEEKPLYGAFTLATKPHFNKHDLLSGHYQPALEKYLEDHLGFRNSLIRLRNQLSLSLLGVARSSDLMVGQDLVLFQPGTVDAYQGKNFLGEEEIEYRVRRLRAVQDTLAKRGIPFLFVMATNKGRYQPETLPPAFRLPETKRTNYDVFMRVMKEQNINLLDVVPLFKQWKDTVSYPLFPKGGTHWSGYGAALVADTLFAHVEDLGKFDLIDFRRQGPVTVSTDTVRFTDGDLSDPMNLILPYKHYPTAYPTVVFDSLKAGQKRPNLLIIGDSFNWAFMQFDPYLQTLFATTSRFWGLDGTVFVYNKQYTRDTTTLEKLNFRQEVESRDFVLYQITEHNLVEHAMIDRLYALYYPVSAAGQIRIQQIVQQLESAPKIQQRLWKEQYDGSSRLADSLRNQAQALYDRELMQWRH